MLKRRYNKTYLIKKEQPHDAPPESEVFPVVLPGSGDPDEFL